MNEMKQLALLKEQFRHKTLLEYFTEHVLTERECLPLDEESHAVFQSNFSLPVKRISTGSHMGFLQWESPFCLSENILACLPALLQQGEWPIITPYSRITFKNASRPGILDLSAMEKNRLRLGKYVIRGRSKVTVSKAQPITKAEEQAFLKQLEKILRQPAFSFVDKGRLKALINEARSAIDKRTTFNEQGIAFSSSLWPHLFPDIDVPPLTMIPMENLRLSRENLLADPQIRELLEKHLEGVYGAMSSTYFYYGSCKCGIEFPLKKIERNGTVFLEGQCLDASCQHTGSVPYSVSVDDIIPEVEQGNLGESVFITFYNVWARAGIDVVGGFNQIEYMAQFKDVLCLVFERVGRTKDAEKLKKRATNLFDLGILVGFTPAGKAKTGSQFLLEGGIEREYLEKLAGINFTKAIDASLYVIETLFGKKPNPGAVLALLRENGMEFMIR